MLSIIVTILKIIGILLLVVLGLILGLLLLVSLVPVRYRVSGSFYEKPKGRAKITWLLHIFSLSFVYDGQPSFSLRIFGIPVSTEKKPKTRKNRIRKKRKRFGKTLPEEEDLIPEETFVTAQSLPESREDSEGDSAEFEKDWADVRWKGEEFREGTAQAGENPEGMSQTEVYPEGMPRTGVYPEGTPQTGTSQEGDSQSVKPKNPQFWRKIPGNKSSEIKSQKKKSQKNKSQKKEKKSLSKKLREIWNKILFAFGRFCDTFKKADENFRTAKSWFQDEKNQALLKLLYRQGRFFLRHILPRKLRGKIVFGFEDPYRTGEVLRYLSLLYPLFHKQVLVYPVFDSPVLEGEIWLKGHIRIATVLRPAVRLLLNKQFRILLKKFLR